jgi:hypothetical protein
MDTQTPRAVIEYKGKIKDRLLVLWLRSAKTFKRKKETLFINLQMVQTRVRFE